MASVDPQAKRGPVMDFVTYLNGLWNNHGFKMIRDGMTWVLTHQQDATRNAVFGGFVGAILELPIGGYSPWQGAWRGALIAYLGTKLGHYYEKVQAIVPNKINGSGPSSQAFEDA